ncbi:MAG TPA: hypothetical protein VLI04_05945 [Nocardioidaceae bacterium]|nr:hypothetical protein [Nocardioidaceae bacterium]
MVQTLWVPPTEYERLNRDQRERLVASGVDPDVLAALHVARVIEGLPAWWHEQGNLLLLEDGVRLPEPVVALLLTYRSSDALVVVSTGLVDDLVLLVEGNGATLFIGPETYLHAGEVYCGGGSSVVFNGTVSATGRVVVDARNGGSIVVAPDQLWAANVYIATDDMHRLEDLETGVRLNTFGGRILLGRHVWLGRDVVVAGDVEIGDGSVVGIGSLVRGQKVAPNTAVAGTPARVIREGIRWSLEDTP